MTLEELKKLPVDDDLINDVRNYYTPSILCYLPPVERMKKMANILQSFYKRCPECTINKVEIENSDIESFIEYIYETYVYEEKTISIPIIDKSKHKNGRTPAEKERRRNEDFIKNTLPKLDSQEKKHFKEKYKGKGYKGI